MAALAGALLFALAFAGTAHAGELTPSDDEAVISYQVKNPGKASESVEFLGIASTNAEMRKSVEEQLLTTQGASYTADQRAALKDALQKGFESMSTSVSLSGSSIPLLDSLGSTLIDLRQEILAENPGIFWMSIAEAWSITYSYNSRTGKVTKLTLPACSISAAKKDSMQRQVDSNFKDMMSWASNASGPYEKAKAIHDWLVRNCVYNRAAFTTGGAARYGNINPWTVYGALVDKSPVCQGYSYAFKMAMDYLARTEGLNIKCVCVTQDQSNGERHMWNRVCINGAWYNLDITHDDPLRSGTATDSGFYDTPSTKFFLKSDAYFKSTTDKSSTGATWHTSWTPNNGAGTDKKYDNYTWKVYGPNALPSIVGSKFSYSAQTYTGKAITPTFTVVKDGTTLKQGTHFKVTKWANNVNAGTATATLEGITSNGYTGSVSLSFQISAASISGATVSGLSNKAYTGKAITQSPTVKVGSATLKQGTDYTLYYKNNVNPGTATITVAGTGNYSGSVSKTFTITQASSTEKTGKASTPGVVSASGKTGGTGTVAAAKSSASVSLSKATVSGIANKTYTGKAITQNPKVQVGAVTLKQGTDYTMSYKNNTKAGTATVTITGKGSYTGSVSKTFKIAKFNLKKAKVGAIKAQKFTGKAVTPKVTVKAGSNALKKGTDYTVTYKNNKKAGTATVTIKGKGSCTGTIKKTFKITK